MAAIDDAIAALEAQRALLGDAVVDTAIEPLLARRAEMAARAIAEQRKLVTVLFSDLVDFTVLSQRLDPEDVRTLFHGVTHALSDEERRDVATWTRWAELFANALRAEDKR